VQAYFSTYKGFTGDGCRRDADGYYWITGRVDDVINVSGPAGITVAGAPRENCQRWLDACARAQIAALTGVNRLLRVPPPASR